MLSDAPPCFVGEPLCKSPKSLYRSHSICLFLRKPFSTGLHSTSSLGRYRHSSESRRDRPEYKPRIEGTIAERKSICANTVTVVIRARAAVAPPSAPNISSISSTGSLKVCGAGLRNCRGIGGGDPRLQVLPDGVRCFVVAPFDDLTLRFGECVHAGSGGGWPGNPVSLAYYFRLEQRRVLQGENFSRNLLEPGVGPGGIAWTARIGGGYVAQASRAQAGRRRGGLSSRLD